MFEPIGSQLIVSCLLVLIVVVVVGDAVVRSGGAGGNDSSSALRLDVRVLAGGPATTRRPACCVLSLKSQSQELRACLRTGQSITPRLQAEF